MASNSSKGVALLSGTGQAMPLVGLGTWHHGSQQEMCHAVRYAIKQGFRHIDCAYVYGNEKKMGEVFRDVLGPAGLANRQEMFIAGKLWNTEHAGDRVEAACRASLADLGLAYFDLYIVHWPSGLVPNKGNVPRDSGGKVMFSGVSLQETWDAMQKLVDIGLARNIGLSNFNSRQVAALLTSARVRPAVLQVESNPRFGNEALRRYCESENIVMVGFSPFGSPDLPWGAKLPHILADPGLAAIAARHARTPAQVVLQWQLQRGVGVIPKSVILSELDDNLAVLEDWSLSQAELDQVAALETGVRKIIPIINMEDGSVKIRDEEDENYPFSFVEE